MFGRSPGSSFDWCFHCYGLNAASSGTCVHCGRPIEAPTSITYAERLIWTLGHPDGDRAMLAARNLEDRHVTKAARALRAVIAKGADPYLATEALRSLIKFEPRDSIRDLLLELSVGDSFMVTNVARRALAA